MMHSFTFAITKSVREVTPGETLLVQQRGLVVDEISVRADGYRLLCYPVGRQEGRRVTIDADLDASADVLLSRDDLDSLIEVVQESIRPIEVRWL